MPENFYNEKVVRGLIGRFKIVVGGMATGSLRHGSFGAQIGTGWLSTGQDRAGQDAMASRRKAAENLTPWYGTRQAGMAPSALATAAFNHSATAPTPMSGGRYRIWHRALSTRRGRSTENDDYLMLDHRDDFV